MCVCVTNVCCRCASLLCVTGVLLTCVCVCVCVWYKCVLQVCVTGESVGYRRHVSSVSHLTAWRFARATCCQQWEWHSSSAGAAGCDGGCGCDDCVVLLRDS